VAVPEVAGPVAETAVAVPDVAGPEVAALGAAAPAAALPVATASVDMPGLAPMNLACTASSSAWRGRTSVHAPCRRAPVTVKYRGELSP